MKGIRKLTDEEVGILRMRKARGERIDVRVEADKFGASPETIRRLLRGETFRHVVSATSATAEPSEAEMAKALEAFNASIESKKDADADVLDLLNARGLSQHNAGVK